MKREKRKERTEKREEKRKRDNDGGTKLVSLSFIF